MIQNFLTIILICPVLFVGLGCGEQMEQNNNMDMFVFHDRHDSGVERVIIEFRGQIVVQVAGFPGYENRSYYGMEHIPSEWQDRIDYWCRQKSQVSPPFVPGPGPYFSIKRMSTQDLSTVNATIYFRDDNEKAREFFIALSDYIINEGVELQDIPQWVSDDNRVTRHLGL